MCEQTGKVPLLRLVTSFRILDSVYHIIKIDDSIQVKIISNVVFCNIKTPDDNDNSFGKYSYRSSNYSEEIPHIIIDANVVFGDLKVIKE